MGQSIEIRWPPDAVPRREEVRRALLDYLGGDVCRVTKWKQLVWLVQFPGQPSHSMRSRYPAKQQLLRATREFEVSWCL